MTGYIGIDPAGVQAWKGQLDSAHEAVISALTNYRTIAQQNNEVAHGSHFQNINAQCDDITNKHLADHNDLHTQYTKASNDLVQGVLDVAGN
jgi:dihydroneopterin aldolase